MVNHSALATPHSELVITFNPSTIRHTGDIRQTSLPNAG